MSATMSMNLIIHAAVRRDIARFSAALDSFPAGSTARGAQLALAWQNLSQQLAEHHEGEEKFFWPAFRAIGAPSELINEMTGEHEQLVAALAAGDTAFATLNRSADATAVAGARDAVRALSEVVESHFSHEEQELEPILTANLETPPIKTAVRNVQRSHSLPEAGRFMAWLADGAREPEKSAFEATIPAPVRLVLTKVVGRGYHSVASVWTA